MTCVRAFHLHQRPSEVRARVFLGIPACTALFSVVSPGDDRHSPLSLSLPQRGENPPQTFPLSSPQTAEPSPSLPIRHILISARLSGRCRPLLALRSRCNARGGAGLISAAPARARAADWSDVFQRMPTVGYYMILKTLLACIFLSMRLSAGTDSGCCCLLLVAYFQTDEIINRLGGWLLWQ